MDVIYIYIHIYEDHSAYMTSLTEKNREKTVSKSSAVVVNVRYPWCTQCKSQDDA